MTKKQYSYIFTLLLAFAVFQDKLMIQTKRRFNSDVESMFSLVDRIIADRKQAESESECR